MSRDNETQQGIEVDSRSSLLQSCTILHKTKPANKNDIKSSRSRGFQSAEHSLDAHSQFTVLWRGMEDRIQVALQELCMASIETLQAWIVREHADRQVRQLLDSCEEAPTIHMVNQMPTPLPTAVIFAGDSLQWSGGTTGVHLFPTLAAHLSAHAACQVATLGPQHFTGTGTGTGGSVAARQVLTQWTGVDVETADMDIAVAWYKEEEELQTHGYGHSSISHLVVLVQDMEACSTEAMALFFNLMTSAHCSTLPLLLLLCLTSTPPAAAGGREALLHHLLPAKLLPCLNLHYLDLPGRQQLADTAMEAAFLAAFPSPSATATSSAAALLLPSHGTAATLLRMLQQQECSVGSIMRVLKMCVLDHVLLSSRSTHGGGVEDMEAVQQRQGEQEEQHKYLQALLLTATTAATTAAAAAAAAQGGGDGEGGAAEAAAAAQLWEEEEEGRGGRKRKRNREDRVAQEEKLSCTVPPASLLQQRHAWSAAMRCLHTAVTVTGVGMSLEYQTWPWLLTLLSQLPYHSSSSSHSLLKACESAMGSLTSIELQRLLQEWVRLWGDGASQLSGSVSRSSTGEHETHEGYVQDCGDLLARMQRALSAMQGSAGDDGGPTLSPAPHSPAQTAAVAAPPHATLGAVKAQAGLSASMRRRDMLERAGAAVGVGLGRGSAAASNLVEEMKYILRNLIREVSKDWSATVPHRFVTLHPSQELEACLTMRQRPLLAVDLLSPQTTLKCSCCGTGIKGGRSLPDPCLLYSMCHQQPADSINIVELYESFAEHACGEQNRTAKTKSSKQISSKGRSREESVKLQAMFVQASAELQFIGVLQQAKRRPNFVQALQLQ